MLKKDEIDYDVVHPDPGVYAEEGQFRQIVENLPYPLSARALRLWGDRELRIMNLQHKLREMGIEVRKRDVEIDGLKARVKEAARTPELSYWRHIRYDEDELPETSGNYLIAYYYRDSPDDEFIVREAWWSGDGEMFTWDDGAHDSGDDDIHVVAWREMPQPPVR